MEIFEEDLDMEPASRFLYCRVKQIEKNRGWDCNYFEISNASFKKNTESSKGQPVELEMLQYSFSISIYLFILKKNKINKVVLVVKVSKEVSFFENIRPGSNIQ
jgi:hypothetical protein